MIRLFVSLVVVLSCVGCVGTVESGWDYSTKQDCYDMFCRN